MAGLVDTAQTGRLIPGDLAGLDASVALWRRRASAADDAATGIRTLPAPEGWTSQALTGYVATTAAVDRRWSTLAQAFRAAASALEQYRSTLAWAQDRADEASRQAAAAPSDDTLQTGPLFGELPQPLSFTDPGAAARQQALENLAAAQAKAALGATSAAAAIRGAAALLDLSPAGWTALADVALDPQQALAAIRGLSASELTAVLAARPDLVALLAQASPPDAAAWWDGLAPGAQNAMIAAFPALVGNLDGVAYGARDEANRLSLDTQLSDARAAVADAEARWGADASPGTVEGQLLQQLRSQVAALEDIDRSLDPVNGRPPHFLVSLTADHPPLGAVAIGDLDTADVITVDVPGMNTSTSDMSGWATAADNLQRQQDRFDPTRSHAVIAWIGYQTPPIPLSGGGFDVLDTADAEAGAPALANLLEGVAVRRDDAGLEVVAHSYGTTTAAIALTDPDVQVDTFVSLGSAGLPATIDEASDLNADEVYAGQATNAPLGGSGDNWAWWGRNGGSHRVDPTDPSFGAQTFGTDTGVGGTPVTAHDPLTPTGTGYFDSGTESLRNTAYATTGQGDRMTPMDPLVLGGSGV